jgi:glycosyltransferase involved in cell wall biosynthesis
LVMNVLFVLPSFPLPAHSGGAIAAIETLRSLHPHCNLSLLVPPPAHDREVNESHLRDLLPGVRLHFYAALSPQPSHWKIYRTAALSMLTGRSYWELIWFNRDLRDAVVRLTAQERFDVVHCEWLQPAVSLAGLDLPLVIRELDVHFIRMRDGAKSGSRLRKAFWRMQANRLRSFEVAALSAAAAVVTLSAEDEAILRREGVTSILTIPPPCRIPIDLGAPAREPDGRSLAVFIGRLDDDVNRDAFFLFARAVWPRVRSEGRARARVVFAGGFPDGEVRRCAAECGLEIHAPLRDDDAGRLLTEADIVLLPIASGTGIKVKTLNAMARGKAAIGFANAFRGVPVTHGVDALIADSPEEFARLFETLIDNRARREAIGTSARERIREHFDPESLATRLIDVYRQASNV